MASEHGLRVEINRCLLKNSWPLDEVFLSTSGGGVAPLTRVDDRIFSNGQAGPITTALHQTYWRWIHEPAYRTDIDYGITTGVTV